ncbi:MAG TPA: NAD(P)H-binding protein, partial [Candidatus Binatia bacterium]
GCETMYFGMSVSDAYLAATVNAAAVAKHHGVKAFINMSQMTLAQMSITETTVSPQHKLHWLSEQALNWSGLPVVHVRPTVLLEGFFLIFTADSVRQSNQIRLPFGEGKTSPVAVEDVARVLAALLANPQPHIGKIYHLTGPQSENMHFYAQEYSNAWPHDHISGHSGRVMAGRAARARLAGSPGEPPGDHGRSAPRGALRPDVGRRAHANGARSAKRAGFRQEEYGDIHRAGKSGLSVWRCSPTS